MPTYDYKCANAECGKEYTYFHLNKDDKNTCPACSSGDAEKLPPKNMSFSLKGVGWHNTDYNKTGRKGRR